MLDKASQDTNLRTIYTESAHAQTTRGHIQNHKKRASIF